MKILLFATVYEYGGVSNVIKNLLDNLDREKNDILFLVERLASRHYPLRSDIKFINMDLRPKKGYLQKLANMFRHLYRLRKIIACESPDIVLGFGSSVNCPLLLSFLWPVENRPKIILTEHTEMIFVKQKSRSFKEGVFRFIYKAIMFLLYHRADAIISVSNSLAGHMEKFLFMDKRKINVIPLPVNIEEVRSRSQEKIYNYNDKDSLPCIGTVSRLSAEKGVNYLIEAFSYLVKRIDARLIIVGDGKERYILEEMARRLQIEDKVSFLGWIDNPFKYLKKMDVFVLSSLWEGFPYVIVESMICGVPVVATRSVGGIEEAIADGVDGLLVNPKDNRALADSMYSLLQDKGLRDRLVEEASKKIELFDAARITYQYESLMLSLLTCQI